MHCIQRHPASQRLCKFEPITVTAIVGLHINIHDVCAVSAAIRTEIINEPRLQQNRANVRLVTGRHYFDRIGELYKFHIASAVNEVDHLNQLFRRLRSSRGPVEDRLELAADSARQKALRTTTFIATTSCLQLKPRLHQIHVAGYKYPGRATCIWIQVDKCRRNDNFVADTGHM